MWGRQPLFWFLMTWIDTICVDGPFWGKWFEDALFGLSGRMLFLRQGGTGRPSGGLPAVEPRRRGREKRGNLVGHGKGFSETMDHGAPGHPDRGPGLSGIRWKIRLAGFERGGRRRWAVLLLVIDFVNIRLLIYINCQIFVNQHFEEYIYCQNLWAILWLLIFFHCICKISLLIDVKSRTILKKHENLSNIFLPKIQSNISLKQV